MYLNMRKLKIEKKKRDFAIHLHILLGIVLLMIYSAEASSMAWGSLVLCSQFNGKLVKKDGTPASGITITRHWKWGWNDDSDTATTVSDEQGNFSFKQVNGSSFTARLMPHEPSVKTEITATYKDQEVTLFSVQKKNYDADGELVGQNLSGPGINLECVLDQEPNPDGPFWGTCRAK